MRIKRILFGIGALVLAFGTAIGIGYAAPGDPVQHGISFTKGCQSPTAILQPYACSFTIRNITDEAQDTLTIHELVDTVIPRPPEALRPPATSSARAS